MKVSRGLPPGSPRWSCSRVCVEWLSNDDVLAEPSVRSRDICLLFPPFPPLPTPQNSTMAAANLVKVQAASGSGEHIFAQEEMNAFAEHLNYTLKVGYQRVAWQRNHSHPFQSEGGSQFGAVSGSPGMFHTHPSLHLEHPPCSASCGS